MPAPVSTSVPAVTANEYVEQQLRERLEKIEEQFQAHALTFNGPLYRKTDDYLRIVVEKRCAQTNPSRKLVILLTTGGGYLDPVQRMVATVRRHYDSVDFVIPNYAYSAGTLFALSGNAIHMDYYSRLGPIDPQIESSKGIMVSALGHVEKFNALMKRARDRKISPAEIQLMIAGFDQGELYYYEQQRALSIVTVKEWLVRYKFKNWDKTETRQRRVTQKMKKDRAADIGRQLSNTGKWHSHGYGISMEMLRKDLKLKIDDFGQSQADSFAIRSYHDLLTDYMMRRGYRGVIQTPVDFLPFMQQA
ncbi:MAG TPA: hypothetical protein VME18_03065 [Acidobacteriaceae bacterium]|nr:hypothetical protein [Acidobacteriaceae bacterium]